jgi:hypothetical protein
MQDGSLAPLDAMKMVAKQRQQLHEKILRLRALREASEADIPKDNKPSKCPDAQTLAQAPGPGVAIWE